MVVTRSRGRCADQDPPDVGGTTSRPVEPTEPPPLSEVSDLTVRPVVSPRPHVSNPVRYGPPASPSINDCVTRPETASLSAPVGRSRLSVRDDMFATSYPAREPHLQADSESQCAREPHLPVVSETVNNSESVPPPVYSPSTGIVPPTQARSGEERGLRARARSTSTESSGRCTTTAAEHRATGRGRSTSAASKNARETAARAAVSLLAARAKLARAELEAHNAEVTLNSIRNRSVEESESESNDSVEERPAEVLERDNNVSQWLQHARPSLPPASLFDSVDFNTRSNPPPPYIARTTNMPPPSTAHVPRFNVLNRVTNRCLPDCPDRLNPGHTELCDLSISGSYAPGRMAVHSLVRDGPPNRVTGLGYPLHNEPISGEGVSRNFPQAGQGKACPAWVRGPIAIPQAVHHGPDADVDCCQPESVRIENNIFGQHVRHLESRNLESRNLESRNLESRTRINDIGSHLEANILEGPTRTTTQVATGLASRAQTQARHNFNDNLNSVPMATQRPAAAEPLVAASGSHPRRREAPDVSTNRDPDIMAMFASIRAEMHHSIEQSSQARMGIAHESTPYRQAPPPPPETHREPPRAYVQHDNDYTYRCRDVPRPVQSPPIHNNQVSLADPGGIRELAAAIAEAAKYNQPRNPPRFMGELPNFTGAASDWLAFRAAYNDTKEYFSNIENAARLRQALKGTAKEAVSCLFLGNTSPDEVILRLESRFGRPDALAIGELEKLRALPRLTDDPRDICIFASRVENIVATVEALNKRHHLYSPEMLRAIVDKLTPIMRVRWYDFERYEGHEHMPGLIKIKNYLTIEADTNARHARPEQVRQGFPRAMEPKPRQTYNIEDVFAGSINECTVCFKSTHRQVRDCPIFKAANVTEKWKIARQHRLCFVCLQPLRPGHTCDGKCSTCERKHHTMLHYDVSNEEVNAIYHTVTATDAASDTYTRTYLKVLPVTVTGPTGEYDTYALLDDGSTITLVTDKVARITGADGPNDPFLIEAIAGSRVDASNSRRVQLSIRGRFQNPEDNIGMTARTINKLDISAQAVMEEALANSKHLADIAGELAYEHGVPQILIGQDNWELLLTSEMRRGENTEPVASLTTLGWVLHGRRTRHLVKGKVHAVIKHQVNLTQVNNRDEKLERLIKDHFALESLGVEPRIPKSDPEVRARKILGNTTRRLDGDGYETGLLWRSDDTHMPDNYTSTLKRLEGIERKLNRDAELKDKYSKQIKTLLDNGYAEPAPAECTPDRTWYLPHFAVINPAKPGKVRIVHDAAARTRGVCLNDFLLTGPDLLQSLLGVLMRFRQRQVAVCADIKDMFLRVKVREQDRDALRFLWRESTTDVPVEYRMCSVLFGATSSPCTALYVKDYNADCHAAEFPEAVEPIKRQHYMDDYLDSFDDVPSANRTARAVDTVHRRGRFELQKWRTNSPGALMGLHVEDTDVDVSLTNTDNISLNKSEKILGLIWRPQFDSLAFNLSFARVDKQLLDGTKTPTKRELLQAAMSLYDPLGLVAPVTIQAKHILQASWREGTDWDQTLPGAQQRAWHAWLDSLRRLATLSIPRAYAAYAKARDLQLHTFVDASERAYCAASYWRVRDNNDQIHVTLTAAKARVTPLKSTSVPRLELQAAVLGSRLAATIVSEHDIKPSKRYFWSDSTTVLSWLRAGSRTFKPFVAHRIAELEDDTVPAEWRWVPTDQNPADDATRETPPHFDSNHRWFTGPPFLLQDENKWPSDNVTTVGPTGEERTLVVEEKKEDRRSTGRTLAGALPAPKRFSSWLRLIRATGRVLQAIEMMRHRSKVNAARKRTRANEDSDPDWRRRPKVKKPTMKRAKLPTPPAVNYVTLEATHMRRAESLHIRALQEEVFREEIRDVTGGSQPATASRLHKLAIILDNEGILRLRSRINQARDTTAIQREPAILDGTHAYCRLYIAHVHEISHHGGVEMVTNEVRQQFWVLRLRPTVRSVIKQCQRCKLHRAIPCMPPTGDLPHARVAHHERPFTYTGLDYFGPMSITVGRQHHKRYGALFTCLTTRAVHIEIAASLSTSSAILALRRMMARRGCPTEIWSDNGSNFRGADTELRKAALDATKEEASRHTIQWRFIPPGAPFMGGAWERMVRSVKTALAVTLHEQHPHEETLATLLAEAEFTINSRPLTHVAVAPNDDTALTPNHFLLGGPARLPMPGAFSDDDLIGRTHWRAAQRLADIFWSRWVREALPLLQHRREPYGHGPPLQLGDLVVVADNNLPRNCWPRGVVVAIYPGPDGVVRTADVRTKAGVMRRPTRKLVVLPVSASD